MRVVARPRGDRGVTGGRDAGGPHRAAVAPSWISRASVGGIEQATKADPEILAGDRFPQDPIGAGFDRRGR